MSRDHPPAACDRYLSCVAHYITHYAAIDDTEYPLPKMAAQLARSLLSYWERAARKAGGHG